MIKILLWKLLRQIATWILKHDPHVATFNVITDKEFCDYIESTKQNGLI